MCRTMLAKVFDTQVSTSGSLLLRLSHQRKGLSTQPPSVPGTVPSKLPSQPPKRLTSDASLQQSCPVRTPLDDPTRSDWEVISDSSSGDPHNILVVDAHLDAIYGAGILRRPPKRRPPSRQWPLHQVPKPHLNIRPPDRQPKNSPPHKKPNNPTPPLRRSLPPES